MILRVQTQGWAWPSANGHAKMHYYRDGRSLCGRWTQALVEPNDGRLQWLWIEQHPAETCRECRTQAPWSERP